MLQVVASPSYFHNIKNLISSQEVLILKYSTKWLTNNLMLIIINRMVEYQTQNLDAVFHALANSTRRDIIMRLAKQDLTVNELAGQHDMSLQAVSKHIHVLVQSGLIVQTKSGRVKQCRVNYEPLRSVSNLIDEYRHFWESNLDSLKEYLDKKIVEEEIMSEKQVVVKKLIRARREKMLNAFSAPEIMREWFFPGIGWSAEVTNEFKVDGQYSIKMREPNGLVYAHTGVYKEIEYPERLVFTWNSKLVQDTLVTIIFREIGDHTEITLTHYLLPTDELREKHRQGWTGCFDNLDMLFG